MKFLNFSEHAKINEGFYDAVGSKMTNDQEGSKKYVLDLLDKTLKSTDLVDLQNFIKLYLEGDANSYILGLSNDSELFEFYAKYQVELDELLSKTNYFEQSPKKMGISTVYDYVTKASKKALELLLTNIQKEAFS